jgi:hypothetical protein
MREGKFIMFSKSMRKRSNYQSGTVMPAVLIFLVVAALIVMPGLSATGGMAKVNQELENSTVAYYAAKAGMEDACWKFKTATVGEIPVLSNLTVNRMTVERTLNTSAPLGWGDNLYVVTSSARLNGVEKAKIFTEINVEYTPEIPGEPGSPGTPATPGSNGYPFQYAITTTGGELKVDSNSLVMSRPTDGSGDVFANNGKLVVDGSIHGKGYYTTLVEGCAKIQKGCESAAPRVFQTLDEAWYLQQAQLGNYWPTPEPQGWRTWNLSQLTHGTSTYNIGNTVNLGGVGNISYINGNLKINSGGKVTLKGVVWVNGFIEVNSNTEIRTDPGFPNNQYYLLAHGSAADQHNIDIGSNTHIYANNNLNLISDNGTVTLHSNVGDQSAPGLFGIIYAPNGHVKFDSNSWAIVSSVFGKSVVLDSNSMVIYDTSLRNNPVEGFELNVSPVPETPGTPGTLAQPASTVVTIGRYSGQ